MTREEGNKNNCVQMTTVHKNALCAVRVCSVSDGCVHPLHSATDSFCGMGHRDTPDAVEMLKVLVVAH